MHVSSYMYIVHVYEPVQIRMLATGQFSVGPGSCKGCICAYDHIETPTEMCVWHGFYIV